MAALPKTYDPELALLVKDPPEGDQWLHELKYDGYRIGCRVDGGQVRLLSRRSKDWTASFPELVAAARALPAEHALLDGEIAVVMPDGRTSFQALQTALGQVNGDGRRGLTYFAFDLLHLDGVDLTPRPLEERKAALARLLAAAPGSTMVRYADHVVGHGRGFFAEVCARGLEGMVSKQRQLPYKPGRHPGWLKIKCTRRQEFVIGGFTDPEGSREGIGALLVGLHDDRGQLVFAGKVGTGYTQKSARELRQRLNTLEQARSPFAPFKPDWPLRLAHWVRPTLVAEVAYMEMTDDGRVRHSSFQGLREDKPAAEVRQELPAPASALRPAPASKPAARPLPSVRRTTTAPPEVAGVRISNADRVVYPAIGLTKLGLAQLCAELADWMLPHVVDRPLTLVRCPNGLATGSEDDCFYMKHSAVKAPEPLYVVPIREKTKTASYLVVKDAAGLVALVQMGVLEIHTWGSLIADVERPDRLIFDLDPGPEVPYAEVVEAARLMRGVLEAIELESFVKTTGGVGLHVVVPIAPERNWDDCLAFCRGLATAVTRQRPAAYTIEFRKAGRERKILIDYLRNNHGSTAVAAFSTRARPTAPMSVPLAWNELSEKIPSDHFTATNIRARLARLRRDPWAGYWKSRWQRLTDEILAAVDALTI